VSIFAGNASLYSSCNDLAQSFLFRHIRSYVLKNNVILSSSLGPKKWPLLLYVAISCLYFCSVAYMSSSCSIGEVVQWVGHGLSLCLLIGHILEKVENP